MANAKLNLGLVVVDTFIDTEIFQPKEKEFTVGANATRRTVDLNETDWTTLDPGDITPRMWAFMNVGERKVKLSWDDAEPVEMEPGDPCLIPGTAVPAAQSVGGAGKLLYLVLQASA
jgi:hypothetical protein